MTKLNNKYVTAADSCIAIIIIIGILKEKDNLWHVGQSSSHDQWTPHDMALSDFSEENQNHMAEFLRNYPVEGLEQYFQNTSIFHCHPAVSQTQTSLQTSHSCNIAPTDIKSY